MFRILQLSELAAVQAPLNFGYVPRFVSSLLSARTGTELAKTVPELVKAIGFETFEYGAVLPGEPGDPDIVIVSSACGDWIDRYARMMYFRTDPRVQNCLHHVTPFLWECGASYGPSADAFLRDATHYGLRSGIALPMRSPVGENAMFWIDSSKERLPNDAELQLAIGRAYLFASYFHDCFFHNLRQSGVGPETRPRNVSKRELEVLALASRGHSSKRIAWELRISESTANYHIASAKRKLGVRTRSQAVARAVQAGLIR
jgi:DNA-binding CsgD family transcriptional regulator